ncbi:MAG: alpha/beta hydrolase [Clostridia bacterium]|nr:alpha/beta hydrolase [Clostridia bacterium]
MNKKKLWTGIGVAAGGVVFTAAALYTEIMTSVVARRRSPLTDAIATIAAGDPADTIDPSLKEKARALQALSLEQVEIRSHDGYVLRARWYPAEGAKRTILLAHGWHGSWNMDFSASAPYLHEHDCNLLLIDQRCHGDSGGDLISYGIEECRDIHSWLDWLVENHPGFPIYLCGVSMGAATVLMASTPDMAERVTATIADCGYSTPDEIIKLTVRKTLGGLTAPTMAAVNLNCKLRGGFTFKKSSPIEVMTHNTDIPCLFIHGDADDFVPVRMSLENFYACRAPKELYIVHGAGHGLSFIVDPEGYQKKILDFFAAWDDRLPCPEISKKKNSFFKRRATCKKSAI